MILFYEDGDPLDPRCIERFLGSFPKSYAKVVTEIIEQSQSLTKEAFMLNVAKLMPSFLMTRAGVFRGVKLTGRKTCRSKWNNRQVLGGNWRGPATYQTVRR